MLKNYFNDDKLFESVYNEGKCGAPSGHCGANKLTCGGGGCGANKITEAQKRSTDPADYGAHSYAIGGCGALGYVYYCKVGEKVAVKCFGDEVIVGELLGNVDIDG